MELQGMRKAIIRMTNYEKAKTMFLRTNAKHVDRYSTTIAVVEEKCCKQNCAAYL